MEFSRPEYWSGKPFPSPGDLPNPGVEPRSSTLQANSFFFLFIHFYLLEANYFTTLPWVLSYIDMNQPAGEFFTS